MLTIDTYSGNCFASDYKIAIIASEFNGTVVEKLLQDVQNTLMANAIENITIIRVPGAFEIPFAARLVALRHEVVIALGAVIRGETPHFDYICQACMEGITRVMHDTQTPIIMGVLTTNTLEQAMSRAYGTVSDEKTSDHSMQGGGVYVANAALRMASLTRQLKK